MIRALQKTDLEKICRIVNDNWKPVYAGYINKTLLNETGCEDRASELKEDFYSGKLENYIYEKDGQAVALLSFGDTADPDKAGAFEIWRIYLDKSVQGCGIGSQLLGFAEKEAANTGRHEIVIWTFSQNAVAISFYEKHGYHKDKTEYLGEPYLAYGTRFLKTI